MIYKQRSKLLFWLKQKAQSCPSFCLFQLLNQQQRGPFKSQTPPQSILEARKQRHRKEPCIGMAKLTCLIVELRPWPDQDLVDTPAIHSIVSFYLRLNPCSLVLQFSRELLTCHIFISCIYIFPSCIYIFIYSH